MMRLLFLLLAAFGFMMKDAKAQAQTEDLRILNHAYRPDVVYDLQGHMGFSTTISFGKRIVALTLGDPAAWDVSPFADKTILTIKPIDATTNTNMSVVTSDGKVFPFRLRARQGYINETEIQHRIVFRYPDEDAAALEAALSEFPSGDPDDPSSWTSPDNLNFNYAFRKDETLRPVRAFDDGRKTYFQWPENRRMPAVFFVDAAGNESLVNYSVSGNYMVIHGVSDQFTFRDGAYATCIYNLSPAAPSPGFDQGSPDRLKLNLRAQLREDLS